MARTKQLNFVVEYVNTGYYVNDNGPDKQKRFELYYEPESKIIMKTNNPLECTKWIQSNIWKEFYE